MTGKAYLYLGRFEDGTEEAKGVEKEVMVGAGRIEFQAAREKAQMGLVRGSDRRFCQFFGGILYGCRTSGWFAF